MLDNQLVRVLAATRRGALPFGSLSFEAGTGLVGVLLEEELGLAPGEGWISRLSSSLCTPDCRNEGERS